MNERIDTDTALALVPVGELDALTSDYLELLGGEPSVVRALVLQGIVEAGIRVIR